MRNVDAGMCALRVFSTFRPHMVRYVENLYNETLGPTPATDATGLAQQHQYHPADNGHADRTSKRSQHTQTHTEHGSRVGPRTTHYTSGLPLAAACAGYCI